MALGSGEGICPVDISFCAVFEYRFNNFGKTLPSLAGCDKGRQVLHVGGEAKYVFHPGGMRKVLKHGLVVG